MQRAARATGVVLFLLGIAGFIPLMTTDSHLLSFAGHRSQAALLGVFQVSALHNVVHLVLGVAAVVMSRAFSAAKAFLLGGGVTLLVLFLYGLLIDRGTAMNFLPVNSAGNWLHFGLGIAMVCLGAFLGRHPYAKDRR
ncbi:DUF4383 domain-containing protein [soil metagenome]